MLVYLALFVKHKSWRSIDELYTFLESEYQWQDANKEIAKYVIEQNKAFQEEQYQLLQSSTLQSEANRLRMIRLKEQEEETLRLQRLKHSEAERLRREAIEEDRINRERQLRHKNEKDDLL